MEDLRYRQGINRDDRELFTSALTQLGISIDAAQTERFMAYRRILIEWNEKINLTAITDPREILLKHFVDCATLVPEIERTGASVLDVGTGAGFPGVPLKLLRPDLRLTLLDSRGKRVVFLRALLAELGLDDVECLHARAEDSARTSLRESFDIVVSRAVAALPVLAEYCLPFAKPGGKFISMKGSDISDEISSAKPAITALGGGILAVKESKIPFTDIGHSLIIVSKNRHTPPRYPRKAGSATKNPIV